jgi:carboxylate/amino acid/amine transporter
MLYLLFVSLLWAFSFGLIKGGLSGVDSFFVSFMRIFLSLLVFLPFLKRKMVDHSLAWKLVFIGMLQYGIMYISYIYSFQFLQAYEVALFTIFTPLYIALWHDIKRRKFSSINLVAALLAIVGTAVVVWQALERSNFWLGFGLMQISNIAFAVGQVQYKKVMQTCPQVKDSQVFAYLFMGGSVITLVASLMFTKWSSLSVSGQQWLILLYLGVVASGIGFFLWNIGARKVNIGTLAVFNNLKIPLSTAVSLLIFGETVNAANLAVGGSIVLFSLLIAELFHRKVSATGQADSAL